jgi:hypothetical protein
MYGAQFQYTILPFTRAGVDTSAANIALNMNNLFKQMFVGDDPITQNSVLAFTNDNNAVEFFFSFTISGGLYTLTLPDEVLMSDALFAAHVWTPAAEGQYLMHGLYNGTNWEVTISGPYQ